jgi:hypothetical protein
MEIRRGATIRGGQRVARYNATPTLVPCKQQDHTDPRSVSLRPSTKDVAADPKRDDQEADEWRRGGKGGRGSGLAS